MHAYKRYHSPTPFNRPVLGMAPEECDARGVCLRRVGWGAGGESPQHSCPRTHPCPCQTPWGAPGLCGEGGHNTRAEVGVIARTEAQLTGFRSENMPPDAPSTTSLFLYTGMSCSEKERQRDSPGPATCGCASDSDGGRAWGHNSTHTGLSSSSYVWECSPYMYIEMPPCHAPRRAAAGLPPSPGLKRAVQGRRGREHGRSYPQTMPGCPARPVQSHGQEKGQVRRMHIYMTR